MLRQIFVFTLFQFAMGADVSHQLRQESSSFFADSEEPPNPQPPEPSPPPPPSPRPPEPSPPSLLLHFLDGDGALVQEHAGMVEGPPLILHMIVSTFSALGMLILACSLRAQMGHRHLRHHRHLRPAVVMAQPVLQAYGVVPTHDEQQPPLEPADEEEDHESSVASSSRAAAPQPPNVIIENSGASSSGVAGDGGESSSAAAGEASAAASATIVMVPAREWSPRTTLSFTELTTTTPVALGERVGQPQAPNNGSSSSSSEEGGEAAAAEGGGAGAPPAPPSPPGPVRLQVQRHEEEAEAAARDAAQRALALVSAALLR